MSYNRAPDLQHGFLRLGSEENYWQTPIECLLTRRKGSDEKEIACLSHECRAESVSDNIFGSHGNYEFVIIHGWDETVSARSGIQNFGFNPIDNFRRQPPETNYVRGPKSSKAFYKEREITPLSLDEALTFLHKRNEETTMSLFMKVEYEKDDYTYELFAPCKYINYSAPGRKPGYIQPIVGYVLFDDGDKFLMSYVAAHIRENVTQTVEFRIRELTTVVDAKNKNSRAFPFFKILDLFFLRFFFLTDDFTRIKRFRDATCTLFVYSDT